MSLQLELTPPPPVITNILDAVGPVQGTVPVGGATDDAQPTIIGTGIPGDLIYIYQNGINCGGTWVDANGNWSLKLAVALTNGLHDMTAAQFVMGGQLSGMSNHWPINVNLDVPAKPVMNAPTDDYGVPITGTTSDTHPVISGTGTAGDTITLYDGSKAIGSVIIGIDGRWSLKPATDLSSGTHDIYVIETNPAGNASAPSDHASIVVNTNVAPVITNVIDAVGPVQGTVAAGGVTDDPRPSISGTGIPGYTVNLYQNDLGWGAATVGADGKWTIKISTDLSNGVHDFITKQFGPDGVMTAASNHWSVTVDTTTPAKPVITGLTDDAGAAIPAGGSTINAHPTVSGTAKAGDIVTLYDGSTVIGSVKVGADGKWSIKPSKDLSVGSHDVYAIDTNLAGVVSPQSAHVAFTVTWTFAAPVILNVVDSVGPVQGTVAAGGVTDDPRPSISGTGIPGYTVYLYQNGLGCGEAKVSADGKWTIKITNELGNGAHDFIAKQFGSDGVFTTASNHWSITVDTTPVAKPVVNPMTDDSGHVIGGTTTDAHPNMSGTGKAGDTITVYDGSKTLGSVVIGADGKWSFKPTTDLSAGTHDIYVIETNLAGAVSPQSDHTAITVTSSLTAPVILNVVDALGPIQGTVAAGGVTDDPRPSVSGTGIPGYTVYLYQNNLGCGETKVGADGKWTIKLSSDLTNGAHDFTAKQFGSDGVFTAASNHWSVTVDTTTPAKPVITGLTDDAGAAIPTGGSTINAHPTVSGTAKAGDIVTLYDGATAIGSAKVGADGKWSIKPSKDLSVGSHDVYAIDTNLAGAVSPQSAHVAFTVTSSLTAPVILNVVDSVGPVQGTVAAGGVTDDPRPSISGTGIPGYTVYLYQNDLGCGEAKVGADGKWTIKLSSDLTNGAHDFIAKQFGSDGVFTTASNHWSITVDTTPVAKPVVNPMTDDSGHVIGGTTTDAHPNMSGTGKAGDTITVYDGSKTLGSVVIGADGKWSFKPTTDLSAGTHDIYVIETNLAGAVSPQSDHTAITVSTVLPAPTPVITQFIDAVGFVQGNIPSGGTSDDSRPTIKGTGHAGDTISLFDGTTAIGSTVVDSAGNWSVRLGDDLARGTHSIHANASSSTTSSSASSNTYVVLMTAPATVPVITQLIDAAGPVQGNVATGGTTDDKTPTLKGTGNPGDQVDIHDGSVTIGGTKVDASGNWSIKLPSLSDSVHTLTAWSFNGVNWSSSSVVYTVTVDTTTPAKPVITGLTDDAGAAIPAGGSTINAHPTVSGTAKAGDIVTLYDGATAIGSAKVGADGKWSIKPSKDLSVGSHDVYAIDTNLAGAVSPQSVHVAFTVTSSLTAPVILNVVDSVGPVQGTVAAGGVTDDPRPSISGTGIPGYTVYLYQNDLGCGEAKVGADGKWTIKITNELTNGAHDFTAKQFGSDGVFTTASNHWSITVDTTTPVKPVITGLADDAGAAIPAGGSTINAHPTVSGTAKAGDIVTLYDGSTVIGSAKVGADGKWSIKPSKDLSVGSHDVYAIDTNLAGAVSPQSAHVAFTVTSAFVPPVILNVADANTAHTGTVPAGGTTTDTHPTVSGTGIPGYTVNLYQNTLGCGATTVGADGKWSIKIPGDLSIGAHDFTATQFGVSGGESAASNHWSITVGTAVVAPTEVVTITGLYDDTSGSLVLVNKGGSTLDTTPIVKGTVDHALLSGESLAVYRDGTKVGTATMNGSNWSFADSGVGVGSHTYTARVENSAGNSAFSAGYGFTETSPFAPPVILNVADANTAHTGTVPAGGTTTDTHPTVSGTGIPGYTVNLYQNTLGCGATTVGADGKWSIKIPGDLSIGAHDFTATQFGVSGGESAASNHWSITVGTPAVAPTEVVTITGLYDDTSGSLVLVNKGGSTLDTTPIVKGTVDHALLSGESLAVYRDGTKVGTATMNGSSWSFNDSGVGVGSHTYTARVENSVGNSGFSAGYSFTESANITYPKIGVKGVLNSTLGIMIVCDGATSVTAPPSQFYIWQTNFGFHAWTGDYGQKYWVGETATGGNVAIQQGYYLPTDVFIFKGKDASGNAWTMTTTWGALWSINVLGQTNYLDGVKVTYSAMRDQSVSDAQEVTDLLHASVASNATVDQAVDVADHLRTVVGEHESFKGTTGHDTVDLNADPTSYFKESTAHIEGSTVHPVEAVGSVPAANTLHLTGDHQVLDLTSLTGKTAAAKISGIEAIDLGGHHNTLKLSLTDVLNLGETDLFMKDGKQQMMVQGKEGDEVDLSNSHIAGLAEGEWQAHGTAQVGGVTYNVYEHSGAHTELLVQQGVQIVVH